MSLSKFNSRVTHRREHEAKGVWLCVVGEDIKFNAEALRTYHVKGWQSIFYDAMFVAAAVEACDFSRKRAVTRWRRQFDLTIPVHEPEHWNSPHVQSTLTRALRVLTGDSWDISFIKTKKPEQDPVQSLTRLPQCVDAVMLVNDGLDSLAVSKAMEQSQAGKIIHVGVGTTGITQLEAGQASEPFACVPFNLKLEKGIKESSGRSIGFKLAALGGIAAYLTGAKRIVVPESGQGTLGPALAGLGQVHPYRGSHPQFTALMSNFFEALFDRRIEFEHPALWKTKGKSLLDCKSKAEEDDSWSQTRSCWKDSRQAPMDGKHRQCGVCPACMLRRVSLHAAGYHEDPSAYIWGDLSFSDFWKAVFQSRLEKKMNQLDHAIPGVLHMDRLAALATDEDRHISIQRQARILANALGIDFQKASKRIQRLLDAHAEEWRSFVRDLPKSYFIRSWIRSDGRALGKKSASIHRRDNFEIGRRLRIIRENKGFTQAEAAVAACLPKTTLVAIEKGDRPANYRELKPLMDIYKVTMNEAFRSEALHVDLAARFRKISSQIESGIDRAVRALNYLASAEVELETLLGIVHTSKLPLQKTLKGDVRKQARADALELRQNFGLGERPIHNIHSLLELDLGVRIYDHHLEGNISGLFAYDDVLGACVLINSRHSNERQAWTAAHELGRIIIARQKPDILQDGFESNSREERYATAFSSAFLMPEKTVRRKFEEIHAGSKQLTRRHVIILARYFGVPREALVRHLEYLELTPDGMWNWFQRNGGITDDQAAWVMEETLPKRISSAQWSIPTSTRLGNLAAQALEREILSEGQVAKLLKIDRAKARDLLIDELNRQDDANQLHF